MSKTLHIAYVCGDRGAPIGGRKGSSTHIGELTRALADGGAEVRLIVARTADGLGIHQAPAATIDLASQRAVRLMRHTLFAAATSPQQQARAAELYGLLLNQTLARELEQLHRRWRIDAVYERYSLWSYAAASFTHTARLPYLLEVNAPLRLEQRRYRTLENPAVAASLESYLFRRADRVIVPSAELRPYVLGRGVRPSAVCVIPNAADPELFGSARNRAPARDDDAEFVVGFLGTLKPWHGLEDLIRAFRRLRRLSASYRLLIAGDGPLRATLEKAVRRDGLQRAVTFSGDADHAHIPALLAQMHVAVAPYPRLAGFYFSPLKVFEYMAAGVPVVASDIGQIGTILTHRKTALLHRPGAVREMVAHIEDLRRHPALRLRLASAARRLVTRRFTWRRNAGRVLAMIASVQRRNRRTPRHAAGR